MNKLLQQYWIGEECENKRFSLIESNSEYGEIIDNSVELDKFLLKTLGREKFSSAESITSQHDIMKEEIAFQIGFEYACDLMRLLGFGGVVNG